MGIKSFKGKSKRKKLKSISAVVLSVLMVVTAIPATAFAAGESPKIELNNSISAHDSCHMEEGSHNPWTSGSPVPANGAVSVSSFNDLKAAVGNTSIKDILLTADTDTAEWTADSTISINESRTVHISVEEGKTITIKRNHNNDLITVGSGTTLVLGEGTLNYAGDSLEAAAQLGNYELSEAPANTGLILDGGAVWTKTANTYTPGTSRQASKGTAIFYDEEGNHYYYNHSEKKVTSSHIISFSGHVKLWSGVTIQNAYATNGLGSAIYSGTSGSTLTMYGGEVTRCAADYNDDRGVGAIYLGNTGVNWVYGHWDGSYVVDFKMYGGRVTNNTLIASTKAIDGGGIAIDDSIFTMYGGEVSYNHAGPEYILGNGGGAGDGGGVMVRCGSKMDLYGGRISHNYGGGYGGGVVAWNGEINIHGGEITENVAIFGGGIGIAASNEYDTEKTVALVRMDGGTVSYNEAIAMNTEAGGGYGGGICAGSGTFRKGAHLILTGGRILQNKSLYGGGLAVYAQGNGSASSHNTNTDVTLSGDFQMSGNSAIYNGNGVYIKNTSPANRHYLFKLSGNAVIDSNNPVYFENLCVSQVPVKVTDRLLAEGAAAFFEFSDSFWNSTSTGGYDHAAAGRNIIDFADGLDIQENKISLDSTAWYLKANQEEKALEFQAFDLTPQYTIRNGTPVTIGGKKYYKVYQNLADAVSEADSGDTLYIFYNTSIDKPAVLNSKNITLLAESTTSASRAAALSGSMFTATCVFEETQYGYDIMKGLFLKYVGNNQGTYNKNGADQGNGAYQLMTDENDPLIYNIRNDYTVSLSKRLYLGEETKTPISGFKPTSTAAIYVDSSSTLNIGQTAAIGQGAGLLTFDGNLSYPLEGPMFSTDGTIRLYDGITIKNHSNYSLAHPGAVEVNEGGQLDIHNGIAFKGNVSPIAGVVYNEGTVNMIGGSMDGNYGAMPRYGFFSSENNRLEGYDVSYWGQPKYYYGAGAVYNIGTFNMTGGSITNNRGEHGGIANNAGGVLNLTKGSIENNLADVNNGTLESCVLSVTGYTEGAKPSSGDRCDDAGYGGGLYISGTDVDANIGSQMVISGNIAKYNGGGIAVGNEKDIKKTLQGYSTVVGGYEYAAERVSSENPSGAVQALEPTFSGLSGIETKRASLVIRDEASISGNTAFGLGGGLFIKGDENQAEVEAGAVLKRNLANTGGGIAATMGSSLTFSNEITENEAVYGGGIYVGGHYKQESIVDGVDNTIVNARGSITANKASHGAGAYVDSITSRFVADGSLPQPVAPPANSTAHYTDEEFAGLYGQDYNGEVDGNWYLPGILALNGAYINNNLLSIADGCGQGVYNRGRVILSANGTAQPTLSYNDVLYLEKGHIAELHASYDIANAQSINNNLVLDSRDKEKGTAIIDAGTETLAQAFLDSRLGVHKSQPLAKRKPAGERNIIELNYMALTYYNAFPTEQGAVSSLFSYVPGETVTINNFEAASLQNGEQVADFELPEGKILNYWAKAKQIGGAWSYVDQSDNPVSSVEEAKRYTAGSQIKNINDDVVLVAVTTNADFTVKLLDSKGATIKNGTVNLSGVSVSASGEIYIANMANLIVTPIASRGDNKDEYYLSSLKLFTEVTYEEYQANKEAYPDHYVTTGSEFATDREYYRLRTEAVIQEHTGKLLNVINYNTENQVTTAPDGTAGIGRVDENGSLAYLSTPENMLVQADFVKGKVRLDIYSGLEEGEVVTSTTPVYTGWFETCYEAYTKYHSKYLELADSLQENSEFVGKTTIVSDEDTVQYGYSTALGGGGTDRRLEPHMYYTIDINGKTLQFDTDIQQGVGEDSIYRIINGTLVANPQTGKDALFDIGVGATMTYERLVINTEAAYSARANNRSVLNIDNDSRIGDVLLAYEGEGEAINNAGKVNIIGAYTENTTLNNDDPDKVATLCIDRWNYEGRTRKILELPTGMSEKSGNLVRGWFDLKDVGTDNLTPDGKTDADDAQKWFIGTDGYLYRKAFDVVPRLMEEKLEAGIEDSLTQRWSYIDNNDGVPGTPAPHTKPLYYLTRGIYGYDVNKTKMKVGTYIFDGYNQVLSTANGNLTLQISSVKTQTGESSEIDYYNSENGIQNGESLFPYEPKEGKIFADTFTNNDPANGEAETSFHMTAYWTGQGEYASAYSDYWRFDREGAPYTGSVKGTSVVEVEPKPISDSSVVIEAVYPSSAEYIGPKGAEKGYSSKTISGTVIDNHTQKQLLSNIDMYAIYRKLTTEANGRLAGEQDGVKYYYADELYYTKYGSGDQSGNDIKNTRQLDGADVAVYSTEMATYEKSNYIGVSGWRATLFSITAYAKQLYASGMTNNIVVEPGNDYRARVEQHIRDLITGDLVVKDVYGNELDKKNLAFTVECADAKARLDEDGWPTCEGLYAIAFSPREEGVSQNDLGIYTPQGYDTNYSSSAKGYQALLISDKQLEMNIEVKKDEVWSPDNRLVLPYTGSIYTENEVKLYDNPEDELRDTLKVILRAAENPDDITRQDKQDYTMQVGFNGNPAKDVGEHILLAYDLTGKYIAVNSISIESTALTQIKLESEETIYSGYEKFPHYSVLSNLTELIENKDYNVTVKYKDDNDYKGAVMNVGTYGFTAHGIGNFKNTVYGEYKVLPKNITNSDASESEVTITTTEYSVQPKKPKVVLTYNGINLYEGQDYTVEYLNSSSEVVSDITAAGSYKIVITGKDNFTGVVERDYLVMTDSGLSSSITISSPEEFEYRAKAFGDYGWSAAPTEVILHTSERSGGANVDVKLNLIRCDIAAGVASFSGGELSFNPVTTKLNSGTYVVRIMPKPEYLTELKNTYNISEEEQLIGYANLEITPVNITVTPNRNQNKTYGLSDPQFTYTTDLNQIVDNPSYVNSTTGIYSVDGGSITGSLSRQEGENVEPLGYLYTKGSLSFGQNYIITVSNENRFLIDYKNISDASDSTVSIEVSDKNPYTGFPVIPVKSITYTVNDTTRRLLEDRDYRLIYEAATQTSPGAISYTRLHSAPSDVGDYRVTIDANAATVLPDNYIGARTYNFSIDRSSGELEPVISGNSVVTYSGAAYKPGITVKASGITISNSNYSLSYSYINPSGQSVGETRPFLSNATELKEAGTYTIYAKGKGNYVNSSGSITFTILQKSIEEGNIDNDTQSVVTSVEEGSYVYDGNEKKPDIIAVYNGMSGSSSSNTLTFGEDYTVSYAYNKNAGTAYVSVYGKGNYTGVRVLSFEIQRKPIYVAVSNTQKEYGTIDPSYTYTAYEQAEKLNEISDIEYLGSVSRKAGHMGETVGVYDLEVGSLNAGSDYELHLIDSPKLTIIEKSIVTDTGLIAPKVSASIPSYLASDSATVEFVLGSISMKYWAPGMIGSQDMQKDIDYDIAVKDGNVALSEGNLVTGGSYTVEITGKGNYKNTYRQNITVVNADSILNMNLPSQTRIFKNSDYTINVEPKDKADNNIGPYAFTVSGITLNGDTINYTANGSSHELKLREAGTYTITATCVNGENTYYGSAAITIQPKDISVGNTQGAGEIQLKVDEGAVLPYTGNSVTLSEPIFAYGAPSVDVNSEGNYIVSYENNIHPNSYATATVTGIGNYTGSRSISYRVGEMTYRVDYDSNGGSEIGLPESVRTQGVVYVSSGSAMSHADVDGVPVAFIAWSTNRVLSPLGISDAMPNQVFYGGQNFTIGSGGIPQENVTLYAVWGFDANNNGTPDVNESSIQVIYLPGTSHVTGELPVDLAKYLPGNTAIVKSNEGGLSLEGYKLMGWTTVEPDIRGHRCDTMAEYVALGVIYSEGGRVVVGGSDKYKLYAVWAKDINNDDIPDWLENAIPVIYDNNGGANGPDAGSANSGQNYTISTVQPVRSNATFVGWTTERQEVLFAPLTAVTIYNSGQVYPVPNDFAINNAYLMFYALWAIDLNGNDIPDYSENKYVLNYSSISSNGVDAANIPADLARYFAGQQAVLSDSIPTGSYHEGSAVKNATFIGWTTVENDANTIYERGTNPLANANSYEKGDAIMLPSAYPSSDGEQYKLYAIWGTEDFYSAEHRIITQAVSEGSGTVTATPTSVLDGNSSAIEIIPKSGYKVDAVLINGVAINLNGTEGTISSSAIGAVAKYSVNTDADGKVTGNISEIHADLSIQAILSPVGLSLTLSDSSVEYSNKSMLQYALGGLTLTVKDSLNKDVESTNYDIALIKNLTTVSLDDKLDAGSYIIKAVGKGDYAGLEASVPFTITPRALTNDMLSDGIQNSYGHTGSVIQPEPVLVDFKGTINELTLTKEKEFTVSYGENTAVGKGSVSITGKGNYKGSILKEFDISANSIIVNPNEISKVFGAEEPNLTYSATLEYLTPVTLSGNLGRASGENVGEYSYNIGTLVPLEGHSFAPINPERKFTITAKSLQSGDTEGGTNTVYVEEISDRNYSGAAVKPIPYISYTRKDGTVLSLEANKDYTLTYSAATGSTLTGGEPVEVGTYIVTATAKAGSNYKDSLQLQYRIVSLQSVLNMNKVFNKVYSAEPIDLTQAELAVYMGATPLQKGLDYDISYNPITETGASLNAAGLPISAGAYGITVTAKGSYSGVANAMLTISPAKITELNVSQKTLTYSGIAQAPEITSVKAGALSLSEGDYTVSYQTSDGTTTNTKPSSVGTYKIFVSGKGNFTGTIEKDFKINQTEGNSFSVDTIASKVYDGLRYMPVPVVRDDGKLLEANRDYTVSYVTDLINAGDKAVTITGKGNYSSKSSDVNYKIDKKKLDNSQGGSGFVTVTTADMIYTGSALTPQIAVTYKTQDGRVIFLEADKDYSVSYEKGGSIVSEIKSVGAYKLVISAKDNSNYSGEVKEDFRVLAASDKNFTVASTPLSKEYTGEGQTPAITISDGNGEAVGTSLYEVRYVAVAGTGAELDADGKPFNAGTYDVLITGKPGTDYEGYSGKAIFIITPKAMTEVTVSGAYTYDGTEKTPEGNELVVKSAGESLTAGTDYTVTYSNNVNAGENAIVTVVGKGNYSGVINESFIIQKASLVITPTKPSKVYGQRDGELTYTHNAPSGATVSFSGGLTREAGELVGEYSFSIDTLKETSGNYTLSLNTTKSKFAITKKSLGNNTDSDAQIDEAYTSEGITVGYTGDPWRQSLSVIYNSEYGEFYLVKDRDYTLTFTDSESNSVAEPTDVGTYNVLLSGKEGSNYEGGFAFTLTISKEILAVGFDDVNGNIVTYDGRDWTEDMLSRLSASFNGSVVTISDSNLSYQTNKGEAVNKIVDAGAYKVIVSVQNYDEIEVPFMVEKRQLTSAMVSNPSDAVFNGISINPTLNVTDTLYDSSTHDLLENAEVEISYGDNLNAGVNAGAVIIAAKEEGNYYGQVTKSFTIEPFTLTNTNTRVGSPDDTEYNGKAQIKPPTSVQVDLDGDGSFETTLGVTKNYTLSYSEDTTNVGKVIISVRGEGNYAGILNEAADYDILRRSINASGITVEIIPEKMVYTGSELKPVIGVFDGNIRLVGGVDYEVEYSKNTEKGEADVSITGVGNYKDLRNEHFDITSDFSSLSVSLTGSDIVRYNGKDRKPTIVVKSGVLSLTEGTDFEATYRYNGGEVKSYNAASKFIDAGVYTLEVEGKGNFEGSAGSVVFTILPKELTKSMISGVNASYDYTATAIRPDVSVEDIQEGQPILKESDYTVSYGANTLPGENAGSITVNGQANYTGHITKYFDISSSTILKLSYDANDGSGAVPTDTSEYLSGAKAVLLSGETLSRAEAVFIGWVADVKPAKLDSADKEAELGRVYRPGHKYTVTENTTMYAVWAKDEDNNGRPDYAEEVTVVATAGPGGTITPGTTTLPWGTGELSFTITEDDRNTLKGITVDNVLVKVSTQEAPTDLVKQEDGTYKYTFTNLVENHTIVATFQEKISGGSGGIQIIEKEPEVIIIDAAFTGVDQMLNTVHHTRYMVGRDDGNFYPDAKMTRAEVAQMFYNLLLDKDVEITVSFMDVAEGSWYAKAVNTLASMGILNGTGENIFEPNRYVTRAEFTAIATRFAKNIKPEREFRFSDVSSDAWYYDSVQIAHYYDWISGYPDGSFRPMTTVTRAEVARIVNNMTDRDADKDAIDAGAGVRYPDVGEDHWALYDIIEASTTHDHERKELVEYWKENE